MTYLSAIDAVAQAIILVVCPMAFIGLSRASALTRHRACQAALLSQVLWVFTQLYHGQYLLLPVTILYAWGWWKQLKLNP